MHEKAVRWDRNYLYVRCWKKQQKCMQKNIFALWPAFSFAVCDVSFGRSNFVSFCLLCLSMTVIFLAGAAESCRGCVLKANARKAPRILTYLPFAHDYRDRGFTRTQFNFLNVYFSLSNANSVLFCPNFILCCSSDPFPETLHIRTHIEAEFAACWKREHK